MQIENQSQTNTNTQGRDAAIQIINECDPPAILFKPNFTPYQYLSLFAKVAIERLDADSDLRTASMLDFLLDSYARTYGLECDSHTRDSAHHVCTRRFADSFTAVEA